MRLRMTGRTASHFVILTYDKDAADSLYRLDMTSELYARCPLPDPSTYIRLLRIHVGEEDEVVKCTMSVHTLASLPTFNAISYTWGKDGRSAQIIVNNEAISVTPNCQYALWQARINSSIPCVWIGFVCIDQDDLEEKGHQIAMMGNIFAHAKRCLACVGPSDGASIRLAELCQELRSHLHLKDNSPYYLAVNWHSPSWDRLSCFNDWTAAKDTRAIGSAMHTLGEFARRRYWERLWVVQELCAIGTSRIDVLCGHSVLEWSLLGDLEHLMQNILKSPSRVGPRVEAGTETSIQRLASLIARYDRTNPRIPLEEVIHCIAMLQCENPHDRIYSIMELVDFPSTANPIKPDYDQDELATTVSMLPACASRLQILRTLLLYMHTTEYIHSRAQDPVYALSLSYWWIPCHLELTTLGGSGNDLVASFRRHINPLDDYHRISFVMWSDSSSSRQVRTGSHISAFVGNEARPGDVVVSNPVHRASDFALVLRRNNTGVAIIGQATFVNWYGPRLANSFLPHDEYLHIWTEQETIVPLTIREAMLLAMTTDHDDYRIHHPLSIDELSARAFKTEDCNQQEAVRKISVFMEGQDRN